MLNLNSFFAQKKKNMSIIFINIKKVWEPIRKTKNKNVKKIIVFSFSGNKYGKIEQKPYI